MRQSRSSSIRPQERDVRPRCSQGLFVRPAVRLSAALAIGTFSQNVNAEDEIPFGDARIIIETNATDCDTGIQLIFDGEPWKRVRIEDPDGRLLLYERARGSLAEFGLTEQFNESSEPPMEELVALDPDCADAEFSLAKFQALFPEGTYEFEGRTVEGDELEGEARFSHVIPAGPEVRQPADGEVVDPAVALFVDWDPVTEPIATMPTVPGLGPVDVVGYRVIVQEDVSLPPDFIVDLPADITEVTVSEEYLEPGKDYKLEVFSIDASGNQTLTESTFATMN